MGKKGKVISLDKVRGERELEAAYLRMKYFAHLTEEEEKEEEESSAE